MDQQLAGAMPGEVYSLGKSLQTILGVISTMAQAEPLERERHVYESHLQEWLEARMGKFVLIKDDDVLGFFDTLDAAFNEGTARFGLEPFFVKQIMGNEAVNVSFFGRRLESV